MPLPVGQGPPSPARVARALLDRVVAYYAERVDPDDLDAPVALPTRRFVAGGEPRVIGWDTPAGQVHVAYERTVGGLDPTAGQPAARLPRTDPANATRLFRSLALEVQIVRPAPGLGQLRALPTEQQLDAHGVAVGNDLAHLHAAVREAARDGHLFRENASKHSQAPVVVGDCLTLGPSGALCAVAQGITLPLL